MSEMKSLNGNTFADTVARARIEDLEKSIPEGGEVSDEQIASSVNDWLNEHPEATTTVTNGSVTKEKLGKDVTNVVYGYNPNWKYEPDDSVTEDLEVYVATSSNTPWEKASNQNQNASYTLATKFTGIPKKIRAVLDGGASDTQMTSVNLFFSYDNENWEQFEYSGVGYRGYTEGVMDGKPYCYAGLEPFTQKDKQVDETVFWNWDGLNRESLQKIGKTEQPNYWCLTWNSPNSTLAKFQNGTCHLYATYFSPNPNKWGKLDGTEDVEILAVFPSVYNTGSATANKTLFAVVPAYKGETYKWSAGNIPVWDTVDGVRTLRYLPYLVASNEEEVLTKRFPMLYATSNVVSYGLNGNTAFMPCDWIEGHEYRNGFGSFAQFTVPEDFPYNYLLIPYASGGTINNYNQPTVIDDNRSKEDYEEYLEKQGAYGWLQKAFITVRDWVLKDLPSNEYSLERVDPHAERKDQGTLFAQLSVNNPLHNANVVMFGDSLTDAYGGHVWNDNSDEKGFMTKIAQEFGVYFDNRAKSGTNFQRTSGGVYKDLDGCDMVDAYVSDDTHDNPDYCLFMFGANCWNNQIGDITSTDDKKLYGAVKYCIDAIRNAYPNCIVAIILEYPVADWQNGQKVPHLAHEAIKDLITSSEYDYRVPYLDLYQYNIRTVDLRDGVHPAVTGVNKLHHAIRGFLMGL